MAGNSQVGLDTSVVLRLLVGEPAAQAQRAVEFLDRLFVERATPTVSDLVVAEVYFALQHHYAVPKAEALTALREFFGSGEIESSGVAAEILEVRNLASAKPGFVDRLIHGEYRASAGRMATFEKAARKLSEVEVLG